MINFIALELFRATAIALVVFAASCAARTIIAHEPECFTRPSPPADPIPLSIWHVETGTCADYRLTPALFCGRKAQPHYDGCRWYCVESQ